jgi:hypothetical protein
MKWEGGELSFARIVSSPKCVDMPVVFDGKENYAITKNGSETVIQKPETPPPGGQRPPNKIPG